MIQNKGNSIMQIKPCFFSVSSQAFSVPIFDSLFFYFLCSSLFFPPSYISNTASISVMAAFALEAENNFCVDNAQIERSLLSAFHRIKRACVRDTALSVARRIAEVNLNQPLLSGVSL